MRSVQWVGGGVLSRGFEVVFRFGVAVLRVGSSILGEGEGFCLVIMVVAVLIMGCGVFSAALTMYCSAVMCCSTANFSILSSSIGVRGMVISVIPLAVCGYDGELFMVSREFIGLLCFCQAVVLVFRASR